MANRGFTNTTGSSCYLDCALRALLWTGPLSPLMEIAQPCRYPRECFVCASAAAKKALDRGPSPATTHYASLLTTGRVVDGYVPEQHRDSVAALTSIMEGLVTDCLSPGPVVVDEASLRRVRH